jgi:hypothetical protein
VRGLLADVNVHGHLHILRRLLVALDLSTVLAGSDIDLVTFSGLELPRDLDDRELWNRCQQGGRVLFTDNRNNDGPDSLEATLSDSWRVGHLPILTISSKDRFKRDRGFADRVAADIAETLFGIPDGLYLDQPRIYVPLKNQSC